MGSCGRGGLTSMSAAPTAASKSLHRTQADSMAPLWRRVRSIPGYDSVDASVDLGYDKWRLRAGYKLRDNLGTGAGNFFRLGSRRLEQG